MDILHFPDEILEKFFSYLSFAELSSLRAVCTRFNRLCGAALTRGFLNAEKFHSTTLKAIKSKLPRRESERKVHPLSKHCDVLSAVETRMSMLSMTYLKWIEARVCPFIPGKVLDEIMKVLRKIDHTKAPRAHDMCQELRDISSMAMEHFEEIVTPMLKKKISPYRTGTTLPDSLKLTQFNFFGEKYVTFNEYSKLVLSESATRRKVKEQGAEIAELRKQIAQLEARICGQQSVLNQAQAVTLDEIDSEYLSMPGKSTDDPIKKLNYLKRSASYTPPCSSKKMKTS